jgi:hypothetical protein
MNITLYQEFLDKKNELTEKLVHNLISIEKYIEGIDTLNIKMIERLGDE